MTSSATSTSADVRLKPGAPDSEGEGIRLQPDGLGRSAFRASHFFVLASLMAATAAVIMSRQSTPEHLILTSITIAAAGLAAAGFYRMLSPLVGQTTAAGAEALSERGRMVLAREKTLVLRALKDLEFDRSMGKVSQADFDEMAKRLRGRALSLMKQLDDDTSGYKTIIERELALRMSQAARTATVAVAEDTTVAALGVESVVVAALCTCGTANDADAAFCKRCGARLAS